MRLFTAIDLPDEILLRLDRLLTALRAEAPINWSPLDNLHVTTKFIGSWPEERIEELHAALSSLPPRNPFDLELKGLGWFPNARAPRTLWVGIEHAEPLRELARATEDRLEPLGIPKETRQFTPHLTLARIKSSASLRRLHEKVDALEPAELGRFSVERFALYRSDPGSNANIYRKLRDYEFGGASTATARL